MVCRSDPDSPTYGKHLTQDEVADMFAPSASSIEHVKQWLMDGGIDSKHIRITKSKGWIHADVTPAQLEDLLKTTYHTYSHRSSQSQYVGTDKYYLPASVSDAVDFIIPGTAFAHKNSDSVQVKRGLEGGAPEPNQPVPEHIANALAANPSKKIFSILLS